MLGVRPSVGLSVCWSVHLLVRPFIKPPVALLVGDTVFLAFTGDFNVASPAQMISIIFPTPARPYTI